MIRENYSSRQLDKRAKNNSGGFFFPQVSEIQSKETNVVNFSRSENESILCCKKKKVSSTAKTKKSPTRRRHPFALFSPKQKPWVRKKRFPGDRLVFILSFALSPALTLSLQLNFLKNIQTLSLSLSLSLFLSLSLSPFLPFSRWCSGTT